MSLAAAAEHSGMRSRKHNSSSGAYLGTSGAARASCDPSTGTRVQERMKRYHCGQVTVIFSGQRKEFRRDIDLSFENREGHAGD